MLTIQAAKVRPCPIRLSRQGYRHILRTVQHAHEQITIKRSERTKRKHATHVHGLDLFGIDLKKAAKLFAGKFATGSSVSKNPQGEDEIVIQGDVGDDIVSVPKLFIHSHC